MGVFNPLLSRKLFHGREPSSRYLTCHIADVDA